MDDKKTTAKQELASLEKVLQKATKLITDQVTMIATLRDKLILVNNKCRELHNRNMNLEDINLSHKKLNGKLRVEISHLTQKPKGIKLSYDTDQPEKETTVFGTKI